MLILSIRPRKLSIVINRLPDGKPFALFFKDCLSYHGRIMDTDETVKQCKEKSTANGAQKKVVVGVEADSLDEDTHHAFETSQSTERRKVVKRKADDDYAVDMERQKAYSPRECLSWLFGFERQQQWTNQEQSEAAMQVECLLSAAADLPLPAALSKISRTPYRLFITDIE